MGARWRGFIHPAGHVETDPKADSTKDGGVRRQALRLAELIDGDALPRKPEVPRQDITVTAIVTLATYN